MIGNTYHRVTWVFVGTSHFSIVEVFLEITQNLLWRSASGIRWTSQRTRRSTFLTGTATANLSPLATVSKITWFSPVSGEEVLIRIWRSPWASRLWTLQEGRLSKSLSFSFADEFYELKHVGLEMQMFWHKALYYHTDIPTWMDRYEKLRDPACYRMIELGAKLEDAESMLIVGTGSFPSLIPISRAESQAGCFLFTAIATHSKNRRAPFLYKTLMFLSRNLEEAMQDGI